MINKLILIILTLTLIASCAKKDSKQKFTINGNVDKRINIDSVYIILPANEEKLVKAPVIDGKFTLTGTINIIQKVVLEGNMQESFSESFILENEKYKVDVSLKRATISGGKINDMLFGYYNSKAYSNVLKTYNKLNAELMTIDMDAKDEMEFKNREIDTVMRKLQKMEDANFEKILADEKAPTLAKMFAVISSQNYSKFHPKRRKNLLAEYEKELGVHPNVKEFLEILTQQENDDKVKSTVANGSSFKPVKGLGVNGKELLLSAYTQKNKYTLLEFWASWCSPCRAEIPTLKKAYAKYKDKGLEIYSISTDTNKEDWKKALKEDKPKWVQVIDQNEVARTSYGIDGIPASFLIDQNGIILAQSEELRGENLDEVLSKLLK